MGLLISVGQWGGFQIYNGKTMFRLTLGFVGITVLYFDGDLLFATLYHVSRKDFHEAFVKATHQMAEEHS